MKKILHIISCMLLLIGFTSLYSWAQYKTLEGRELPILIKLEEPITIDEELTQLKTMLHINDRYSFRLMNTSTDNLGFTHYRYQQLANGIPVEGSMWIVHAKNNMIQSVNGDVFTIITTDTRPQISSETAFNAAKNHFPASQYVWELTNAQLGSDSVLLDNPPTGALVYVPQEGLFGENEFRLAYKFDMYAVEPENRAYVFIDATDGRLLWKVSRIHTIHPTTGQANTLYSSIKNIITDSISPISIRLADLTRGQGIVTKDMNGSSSSAFAGNFVFNATNNWQYTINAEKSLLDAHWGAEITYDYFKDSCNLNSFDGAGAEVIVKARYGNVSGAADNAFWNGTALLLGRGIGSYNPLTTVDIVAHEFTHAVVEYSSALYYLRESGALNESFADIFGNVLEYYNKPLPSWKLGEEINNGSGIRDMSNPKSKNDPDTYLGQFWHSTLLNSSDAYGVHTNSGVQNFWFYLLSDGGAGTNDNNDSFNIQGIGISKASKIAYRNMTVYMTPLADYELARIFAIESAADLYGACSNEVIQTTNAWYAVGVGDTLLPSGADFTNTPETACGNLLTVKFYNTSNTIQSSFWDFGDGNTSTDNHPTHTYTQSGNYNVKLVVTHCDNTIDSIIKNNAVVINATAGGCDTIRMTYNETSYACNAVVTDGPGPFFNYGNNTYSVLLFNNPNATQYKITFLAFHTQANFDNLYVYDGNHYYDSLIGTYSGSTLPNAGNPIYTTGNELLLIFISNSSTTAPGYIAQVECLTPLNIDLINWKANVENCQIHLEWEVANAVDFSHFEIERSFDGKTFSKVSEVAYVPNQTRYKFLDAVIKTEMGKQFYRLKMFNINGQPKYSDVLTLLPTCGGNSSVTIFPNPATDKVQIASSDIIQDIRIIDITGKMMRRLSMVNAKEYTLDIADIPSGLYMVEVINEFGMVNTMKLQIK